tara:strand:- start:1320 stop:2207 length:888 start_codon:yes stop_codon:yes gene_type:complete
MRRLELLIDEESEQFGVEAISLVYSPAIEENFIFLNKAEKLSFAKVDEEKRLLIGPALIPNKSIMRYDQEKAEEYEVFFSESTVAQAAELFLKEKRTDAYTIEHKADVNGLTVFESWIVQDAKKDKASLYGFEVPVGTWMVSVKVYNDEVWKQVKAGDYRGFSIEGWFVDRLVHMQKGPTLEEVTLAVREALVPIDFLDGAPLFATAFEAGLYAETIGCSGSHVHNLTGTDYYMPCENHEQAIEYEGPTLIVAMDKEIDLAAYPWDECVSDQMAKYGSKETAEKICGAIKAKYGG